MLGGIPYRVLDLAAFPFLTLPAEGAVSYAENARLKARAVAAATRTLALAVGSGSRSTRSMAGPVSCPPDTEAKGSTTKVDGARCSVSFAAFRPAARHDTVVWWRSVGRRVARQRRKVLSTGSS